MNDPATPAHLLAQLIHTDLHKCLFRLELMGSSFAAAHLSAAIDALRADFTLPPAPPPRIFLLDSDLSQFDDAIENLVRDWPAAG